MRTNIDLDEKLVKEASRLTGIKVKKHLINEALKALVQLKRRKPLLEIAGKIEFDPKYDYKSLRRTVAT